jgi:ABC-2 type transport system ATP-binding protein
MSRGMRQKLGLILALAHSPRLLVLDEPTSALDPLMQQVLHSLLRERAATGHTVFFSSHSLGEVEELCDRVAIVRDGQLVTHETLAALRNRAGHQFSIHWAEHPQVGQLEAPKFMKLTKHEPAFWQGTINAPVGQLIEFLAGKPVADLSIGRPDLESLFRSFYHEQGKTAKNNPNKAAE